MNQELEKIKQEASEYNDKCYSMWQEDDGSVTGYMCLVDFECELGAAGGGNTIYPTIDNLIKYRKCVEGCGIVEVEVKLKKVLLSPADYYELPKEDENVKDIELRQNYVKELINDYDNRLADKIQQMSSNDQNNEEN